MKTPQYEPPVDLLLACGEKDARSDKWPDYLELGFTTEHISDLIRMATDKKLFWADSESMEVWAPLHAWRVLGQLKAEAAIEPLLQLFEWDDDWVSDELPHVFAMIGPAAIPALSTYLEKKHKPADDPFPRIFAIDSLVKIAEEYPETQQECVMIFSNQLEAYASQDETLNAFLISALVDLKALDTLPLIEKAFDARCVDVMVIGDWEDIQVELGLKTERETSRWKSNLTNEVKTQISSIVNTELQAHNQYQEEQFRAHEARVKKKTKREKRKKK